MNGNRLKANKPMLEELTWRDVREELQPLNPEFVQVVDELSPGDECVLFKAKYPYGSEILKQGKFYLPGQEGTLIALDDPNLDRRFQALLSYNLNSNPVSFLLKNSTELFSAQADRTLPLGGLTTPGNLFGLFRILTRGRISHQPKFTWEMTAGARSIFMLPKVSERESFKRLKREFNLSIDKPKELNEHWTIFKEIANHPNFGYSWSTDILFFSKPWFEHLDDRSWEHFNYFLYRYTWDRSDYWRNQFVWNLIFSIIQKESTVRPNSFIADTVKCLFSIAVGNAPGFAPALDNFAAPIEGLQKAYCNVYGLKNYLPVIMQPQSFKINSEKVRPVYYSLQFPTAIEFGPKSSKHTSLLTDLYDLKQLFDKHLEVLKSNIFNIEETPLYRAIDQVAFDFIHTNMGAYEEILDSQLIAKEDDSFLNTFIKEKEAVFPAAAAFLKGCVRIAKSQHDSY